MPWLDNLLFCYIVLLIMSVRFNKGFKTDKYLLNKQKGYFCPDQRLGITQSLELSCPRSFNRASRKVVDGSLLKTCRDDIRTGKVFVRLVPNRFAKTLTGH